MASIQDKITKEDIQLMTQAGFVALNHGWHIKANVIFSGIRALRPKSEVPSIGFCMNLIAQNKLPEALRVLSEQEHFFTQNNSTYHLILKAIILRLMDRFVEALQILSTPGTNWGEYAQLAHVLAKEIKSRI